MPPSKSWGGIKSLYGYNSCSDGRLNPYASSGDGKRAWESLGGLNAQTKAEVRIAKAALSDPESLRSVGSYSKSWEYTTMAPSDVFRKELDSDESIVRSKELAARAASVAAIAADVGRLERELSDLKPERASSQALVDAEAQLPAIEQVIATAKARLAELNAPLSSASARKQSALAEVGDLEKKQSDLSVDLRKADADLESLKANKGTQYEQVTARALGSFDARAIQSKWYRDLLALLKSSEAITVQSDVDGRYRFEKVTWKDPILFAVSDERTTGRSTVQALRPGNAGQRVLPAFWLETVDTAKTTLVDLGQAAVVVRPEASVQGVMDRIAAVVGIPGRTVGPLKAANDPETICTAAHRSSLLNPESLEVFEFQAISRNDVEIRANQAKELAKLNLDMAKIDCMKRGIEGEALILACAALKVGDGDAGGRLLQQANALGAKANVYEFRAKASSRDGRTITHTAVCVVGNDSKATTGVVKE